MLEQTFSEDPDLIELTEIDDVEDLADDITYDSEDIPPEAYDDWPDDLITAICSLRGTGKGVLLAWFCLNLLDAGDKVYTNLPLYPEKVNINNVARPLVLDQLLSFDPELKGAYVGIDELHTWYNRKRPMSTASIMADEWLRQIRKNILRVDFTDQSIALPRDVERDVDVFIQGIDMRWTDYGRENNIPRGTQFLYEATDWSSRLTGQRYNSWRFTITFANRLWRLFDSYKAQDPFQSFRKYSIIGGELQYDIDKGKMYSKGEREAEIDEETLERRFMLLQTFWRSFEADLLDVAVQYDAILNDTPSRLEISVNKLMSGISQIRGNRRRAADSQFKQLKLLATGGDMAAYRRGRSVIELAKPFKLEPTEITEIPDNE